MFGSGAIVFNRRQDSATGCPLYITWINLICFFRWGTNDTKWRTIKKKRIKEEDKQILNKICKYRNRKMIFNFN